MRISDYMQSRLSLLSVNDINDNNVESTNFGSVSFMDMLKEKLDDVNEKQIKADEATEAFISGDDVDIHELMLITEEAKMSLQLAVQVRNKLVEAYQEINKMQL
ncbi:Flagellar hook-basal body complex protein FliE [Clostridium sp. N3C]|uniref:flagellar hook-basal body complex protein FliE n=1 Tax=Clostridium sp. N3C TaxID=1776758 RepID=UPI00092E15FC|nr:flagellar hook-basal body complex protein FliE [Clostridium sp. N3C]SCN21302.1 Flagellar hook-basal body complex protein FliE [Clostridium sp. N3C]